MSAREGVKHDKGKPAMHLVPYDALEGVGAVLAFGATVYGERNWELGMKWGRLAAALVRHLARWMTGENTDSDSLLPHLDHAACCALMLAALVRRNVGTDDRFIDTPRQYATEEGCRCACHPVLEAGPCPDGAP